MILQALTRYYEALAERGDITRPGYAVAKVSYALLIGWDGELLEILPLLDEVERGKKKVQVPREMEVPEKEVRTGTNPIAHFLCDHSGFLMGAGRSGRETLTARCYQAAKERHLDILDGVDSAAARAVAAFFTRWDADAASGHRLIEPMTKELTVTSPNLVFFLPDNTFAHDDPAIRTAWEAEYLATRSEVKMQCLVTGRQDQPIAITHGKIKGVRNAQAMGLSVVSFNATAYESYGNLKSQGLNAPVSEYASFAYVTALNRLLNDPRGRFFLGDATWVCWAEDADTGYVDAFADTVLATDEEGRARKILGRIEKGLPLDDDGRLQWDMPFYVLGVSHNAARLAVRFFWRGEFGDMMRNIGAHYRRLEIVKAPYEKEYLTPYWLLQETVNQNARDKEPAPPLAEAVLRAIVTGAPYPESLAQAVLLRIRAEQGVSPGKAAILKAWLMRNRQNRKEIQEVLGVGLNHESENKAYVLGRLFAVLERTQVESRREKGVPAGPQRNDASTIRGSYFTSACATPQAVFPYLLRLSNHHINKAEYGYARAREIGLLLDRLNENDAPFPPRLSLEEQGLFYLGYYQQVQDFYRKKTKDEAPDEQEGGENNV